MNVSAAAAAMSENAKHSLSSPASAMMGIGTLNAASLMLSGGQNAFPRQASIVSQQKNSSRRGAGSDPGRRIRVSITFKVAPGWRGTKSRDFPGRHFDSGARDLLQSWANEFRRGLNVVQPVVDADTRTVRLPDSQAAKRRKPYMGVSLIHRADAFHWFRATQERLMDSFARKEGTVDQTPVDLGIESFFPNVYIAGNSIDSPPNPNTPKDVIDNVAGVSPAVRKHWPETMHMRLGEFIEVKWAPDAEKILLMEDKNSHRFRVYIKFNDLTIPVNIMEGGRGSFIRAINLPPGTYNVNGAQLTVLAGPSNGSKKSKRKRNANKMSSPVKSRKSATSAAPNRNQFNKTQRGNINMVEDVGSAEQVATAHRPRVGSEASSYYSAQSAQVMQLELAGRLAVAQQNYFSLSGAPPQTVPVAMRGGVVRAATAPLYYPSASGVEMPYPQMYGQPQLYAQLESQQRGMPPLRATPFQMPAIGGNPHLSRLGVTLYEVSLIGKMRELLAPIITSLPYCRWPEVVGDVALLRFLRSAHHDADVAAELFREHIQARQEFGFDVARERIARSLAQYPPPTHGSTSPWTHYTQDMMIHGALFRNQLWFVPLAEVTATGDPVQLLFVHDFAEALSRREFLEFLIEMIVRRQIATDIMTMQQGRIVESVVFIDSKWSNIWRAFIAGTMFQKRIARIQSFFRSIPRVVSEVYLCNVSWAVRSFVGLLSKRLGYGHHGLTGINSRTKTFYPDIRRGHCDAVNRYGQPGGGSIDPGTMSRLAGLVLELRSQFRGAAISNTGTPMYDVGNPRNGTSALSLEGTNANATPIESDSGEPRRGTFMLHASDHKEITIEVDSSKVYKVGWSFNVVQNMKLDFEIFLVLEDPTTLNLAKPSAVSDSDDSVPSLVQRPYIQKRRLCSDSGLVDFSDSANIDHAYIIFRWSAPESSPHVEGWEHINANPSAPPSVVASSSYQVHYNFWVGEVQSKGPAVSSTLNTSRELMVAKETGSL